MNSPTTLLEVDAIQKAFGGRTVLDGATFSLAVGDIVALIGPNGSGKTTLMDILSRLTSSDKGDVRLLGHSTRSIAANEMRVHGVARVFQHSTVPNDLTVWEHVELGMYGASTKWERLRPFGASRRHEATILETLELMELDRVRDARASELSFAQRRRTELARAIVGGAVVLLVDEMGAGLAAQERSVLALACRAVASRGGAALFIEHDAQFVGEIANRVVLLEAGRVGMCGPVADVLKSEILRRVYL